MHKLPIDLSFLKKWFLAEKRDLPWRQDASPYSVWISEVMLQQTQVAVVKAYYLRWMERFPTIASLAEAPIEDVIKLWEGLGYYSRARNLHRAASYLVEMHGGKLPSTYEELEKVVGLGPYTIGAILSFAYHQKAAAVDGNVIRVLSRLTGLLEDVDRPATRKKIWQIAESILPDEEPWVIVEALIELGALICTRQPKCHLCPLQAQCVGLKLGEADRLPIKGKKTATTHLKRQAVVILSQGHLLLKKGKPGEVMADLYEFPFFEKDSDAGLSELISKEWGFVAKESQKLPRVSHSFTRYQVKLFPSIWRAETKIELPGYHWAEVSTLQTLPFSSGHRRILKLLLENYANIAH